MTASMPGFRATGWRGDPLPDKRHVQETSTKLAKKGVNQREQRVRG